MADLTNADACRGLTVDPPPHHAPNKDVQGSDNPIPLSPQWLTSKVVDSKELGPNHENKLDSLKVPGTAEDLFSTGKRKDVFRPILDDSNSGRRDRWHDEERETNFSIRRDRWREGDKEPGDTRRIERWTENTNRHVSEARCAPPERWNDSGNKEIDQRRESKWNTRWGPGDKDSDNRREKWIDSSKGGNITPEKGSSYFANHGKETNNYGKDPEGDDHYSRSWRSNYAFGRGRGDSYHHSSHTPVKTSNVHGYSKGRSENDILSGSIGRGRFNSSMSSTHGDASRFHHLGSLHEKPDETCGELSTLRYSRMKMLDIYRRTDLNRIRSSIDEFVEVPPLTQSEQLEPLAFSAPTTDESVIIRGIDKGDIVNSGAQLSKESIVGRNNQDAASSRLVKLGSKNGLPGSGDGYRDKNIGNTRDENFGPLGSSGYEKQYYQLGQYTKMDTNFNTSSFHFSKLNAKDLGVIRPNADETTRFENSSHYVPRRSQLPRDNKHGSFSDRKDFPEDQSETRLSLLQKEMESNHKMAVSSSFLRDEIHLQNAEGIGFHSEHQNESYISRQSSDVAKEGDPFISKDVLISRRLQSPSPEDLSLYYKDPQGQIQGPFSGSDLIQWYDAGYFGIDLQVRLANSSADAPFLSLGDVMPHLKLKAKPPPGFGVAKQGAALDDSLRENFVNAGSTRAGLGENDILISGQRNMNDGLTEKQNRYLESLMSNNMSGSTAENFSFTRGMQEFGGSSVRMPSVGEGGHDANYMLAQARLLERQRSLMTPLSYWSSGDVSPIASKTDIISNSSVPHPKLLPSAVDPSLQIVHPPQQVDLLSLLHVGADKPPRPASSGVPFHSNFPDAASLNNPNHGGAGFPPEVLNMHYNQHVASQIRLGAQQQGLLPTNQAPLPHLITQPTDLSSCIVPPDKLISSQMNQDPRLPTLLQQQYLLSQLQLQAQMPTAQVPLLEKILLLQQQQQQEQQQLLLQQQQQQQMLSKALPGQSQQFVDPSYGQTLSAMHAGHTASVDNSLLQRSHEQFQINQPMPAAFEHTVQPSYYSNLNLPGNLNVSSVSVPSLHLPHPIIDKTTLSKDSEHQVKLDNDCIVDPVTENSFNFPDGTEKNGKAIVEPQKVTEILDDVETGHKQPSICQTKELLPFGSDFSCVESVKESQMAEEILSSNLDQACDVTVTSVNIIDQNLADLTISKEVVEEPQEVKKASEKKSKKQKKSKAKLVLDTGKGLPKAVSSQKVNVVIGNVGSDTNEAKSEVQRNTEESLSGPSIGADGEFPIASYIESYDSQSLQKLLPEIMQTAGLKAEGDAGVVGTAAPNPKATALGAWKSAPGFKPTSLLEILQEEQLSAQRETARSEVAASITSARNPSLAPWSGTIINFENKLNGDTILEQSSSLLVDSEDILKSKGKKSQLHDLLAEEVLAKFKEDTESSANNALTPPSPAGANVDSSIDSDDFVEAKDTRKARKKASKSKAAGVKIPQPAVSAEISTFPSPIEKLKSARQAQQEKESLPAPPTGPSLGDFVVWKGDQASSAPPPAWSMDSRKVQRPISLRDIQSEQEKRSGTMQQQVPIPTPPKTQPNLASRGSGTSWQVPASSPSKASSIQFASSASSQTKSKVEDDLFWGPSEQSKSEYRKSDFPPTENSANRGIKVSVPKGASGAGAGLKPTGGRVVDYSLSSSPRSSLSVSKSRSISGSKNSEAMEFREWCMNQWFRLTGTNDTSFLEFCIKQSTSEAEVLLRENLGSLDPNHEFTDKFLNYKEFLSADVLDVAFQSWKSINTSSSVENTNNWNSNTTVAAIDADEGAEDGAKGRGKKKGKKGQKVNPSILGFSVVSNRIMRGEIQSVEE